MPTRIVGDNFVHTCRYCGHQQTEPVSKTTPFMYTQYCCSACDRPLDDLDLTRPRKKNSRLA